MGNTFLGYYFNYGKGVKEWKEVFSRREKKSTLLKYKPNNGAGLGGVE